MFHYLEFSAGGKKTMLGVFNHTVHLRVTREGTEKVLPNLEKALAMQQIREANAESMMLLLVLFDWNSWKK